MKNKKKIKNRDLNILAMARGFYKPQVVRNKKKYNRKIKHKKSLIEGGF